MAEVVWSSGALADVRRIVAYTEQFNILAAQRLAARLKAAAADLSILPARGTLVRGKIRQLAVVPPYLIRYLLDGDTVTILYVRHAARRPLR